MLHSCNAWNVHCALAHTEHSASKHIEQKYNARQLKPLISVNYLCCCFLLFYFFCCCCFNIERIMKYAIHSRSMPNKGFAAHWYHNHLMLLTLVPKTWEMHAVDCSTIHIFHFCLALYYDFDLFHSRFLCFFYSLHPTHVRKVEKALPIREQWEQKKNRSVFSSTIVTYPLLPQYNVKHLSKTSDALRLRSSISFKNIECVE